MSETFIYTSVFKVREGKPDDYRAFTRRVARLVREQEPAMVHFGIYIDLYGHPTEPIVEQMRSLAGSGASVSISELAGGADHLG